jgi:hypothetical protein
MSIQSTQLLILSPIVPYNPRMQIEAIKPFNSEEIDPHQEVSIYSYGTINAPTFRRVTLESPIQSYKTQLEGIGLRFQPFEQIPQFIQEILRMSWGDNHIGSLSLVQSQYEVTPTHQHIFEANKIPDILKRLAFWNFHPDWYQVVKLVPSNPISNRLHLTEIIGDPAQNGADLQKIPDGFLKSLQYRSHIYKMVQNAQAAHQTLTNLHA